MRYKTIVLLLVGSICVKAGYCIEATRSVTNMSMHEIIYKYTEKKLFCESTQMIM